MKKEIDAHWVYPTAARQLGRSGQVVVAFAIHPDGSVRGIKVVRSAIIEILDRYAVNAIRLAAALLPLPSELGMDCIDLTATFDYGLDDPASGAKPPLAVHSPIPGRCPNITSPSRISFVDGVIAPAEFPYAEYLRLVRAQILERWGPPAPTDGRLRVIVLFELGRDGQLRGEPRVEVSSGHGAFDGAALDAVRAAGPFCRFPSEARPAFLRLHVGFESQ